MVINISQFKKNAKMAWKKTTIEIWSNFDMHIYVHRTVCACVKNENKRTNNKTIINICDQNPNEVSHVTQKYNEMATGFGGDPVSSFFNKVRAKQF